MAATVRGAVVLALAALALPAAARAAPCDGLDGIAVADLTIDRTTAVDLSTGFVPPFAGAKPLTKSFCRVEGRIEKEIGFELWLPERSAWNGRLLVGGVGGQAGQYNYHELARGVSRGYASATTDSGHKADDAHWLLGDAMRAENYAGRANHLLAVKTKQVILAYYGSAVRNAFFVGCSGGGRQALTEVQRYPLDFDGVIAGAPGVNTPEMSARRMWEMQQHSRLTGIMGDRQWGLVADAAIRMCDPRDGVTDGVIDDPRRCTFDPAVLLCKAGQGSDCLTPQQIDAVRLIYRPLHDENGRKIDDGLVPGIRVQATPLPEPFTPGPPYLAVALFGDGVHRDAHWDSRSFSLARDLPAIDRVMNLHADDPDIAPFVANGGKLILYQGWSDPLVSPLPTIDYYRAVRNKLGQRADRSVRLFMAPGVEHCRGGAGPDLFGGAGGDAPMPDADHDLLSALEAWVDRNRPPERIIASRVDQGVVTRTHPLCAFPATARYRGNGDVGLATNFECVKE